MDIHFLYKLINAAIFFGLLYFFLRRPLKEFWRNRSEDLRMRISTARKHRDAAESEYNELAKRMSRIQAEMQALRERMEADGQLEQKKIITSAKEYAKRLEEGGRRVADQDAAKTRYRLREMTARLSITQAERLITGEMTDADQTRLVTQFLDQLNEEDLSVVGGGRA